MNNFWKIANSTERVSDMMICYDTTSYDCSVIYEHRESYSEYLCECRFYDEGCN